jgi:NADH:ubiquinone oxidoreductase subunit 6 (subunit J)
MKRRSLGVVVVVAAVVAVVVLVVAVVAAVGSPNQEIRQTFLFKCHKIGTSSYLFLFGCGFCH